MARPIKSGLDYFPLDVNLDDKVELLEAEHGITGFGVIVKLWQRIFADGYYTRWDDDRALLVAKDTGVPVAELQAIVTTAVRRGIFSAELLNDYDVLTSRGIQKRYLTCIDRRREVELDRRLLLVRPEDYGFTLPDPIEGVNRVIAVNAGKKPKRPKEEKSTASYDIDDALDRAKKLDPTKTKRH